MVATRILFVGVGNKFRQDDGAGAYIVEQLSKKCLGSDAHFAHSNGEGAGLMTLWEGFEQVVLFDALMANGQPGRVVHLSASNQHIPSDMFKYSSHAFSLAEAIELSKVLNRLPRQVEIIGIEGRSFDFGEGLSDEVQLACATVVSCFESLSHIANGFFSIP